MSGLSLSVGAGEHVLVVGESGIRALLQKKSNAYELLCFLLKKSNALARAPSSAQ